MKEIKMFSLLKSDVCFLVWEMQPENTELEIFVLIVLFLKIHSWWRKSALQMAKILF